MDKGTLKRNIEQAITIQTAYNKGKKDALKEHKPDDKIETKFKVGDFLVNDYCMGKVIELTNDAYLLDTGQGIPFSCEHNVHLWTIQDAKDGDVLATNHGSICVYDGTVEEGKYPFAYCGLTRYGFEIYDGKLPFTHDDAHPATKEQRDLLFQKMKESGYEWDAEKKELRKIEQKPEHSYCQEHCKGYKESGGRCYFGFNCEAKREAEKKPVWSEEDEKMFRGVIAICDIWSTKTSFYPKENDDIEKLKNWLKCLKDRVQPQNTWKPTREQMKHLAASIEESGGNPVLGSLYEQLKNLYYDTSRKNQKRDREADAGGLQ